MPNTKESDSNDAPRQESTAASKPEDAWSNVASSAWDKDANEKVKELVEREVDTKMLQRGLDFEGHKDDGFMSRADLAPMLEPATFIKETPARQRALAFLSTQFDSIAASADDGDKGTKGISQKDINQYWKGIKGEYEKEIDFGIIDGQAQIVGGEPKQPPSEIVAELRSREKNSKSLQAALDANGDADGFLSREELNERLKPESLVKETPEMQQALVFLQTNFDTLANAVNDFENGKMGISQQDLVKYWRSVGGDYTEPKSDFGGGGGGERSGGVGADGGNLEIYDGNGAHGGGGSKRTGSGGGGS